MSKRTTPLSAALAMIALCAAGTWAGAQTTVTVESRSVSPDEAFTLNVNMTGATSAAGVNLRITGMGSGLDAGTGLNASQGSINNGHATNTNVLSGLNDFRAVIYNPTTSTNFTGDGVLHTISGRVAGSLANGATIPFTIDTSASAVANSAGAVLAATMNSGTLTVSTPFPQTFEFTSADDNGWTFFNAGSIPPESNEFGFQNVTKNTPGGVLGFMNFEGYSYGFWQSPDSVAPVYRGNLVQHTMDLSANRSVQDIADGKHIYIRMRSDDRTLFHHINEMVVDAGAQSPQPTASSYSLVTERDDDPNSPVNSSLYLDAASLRYLDASTPVDNSDLVVNADRYTNARWSKATWEAAKEAVITNFDLSSPTFQLSGDTISYPYRPDLGAAPRFFTAPTTFFTESAANVWGYEKTAGQVSASGNDMIYLLGKTATGATVEAGYGYIAEFTVNSNLSEADVAMTPHFRTRVNLTGLQGNGLFNQQAWMATVNSFANSGSTFNKLPRAGAPIVLKSYMLPHPSAVGAGFEFSFDYNEVTDNITANTLPSRIWVSRVDLYRVNLSSISPIE